MPVTTRNLSRAEIEARRDELLVRLGMTWDELSERRTSGVLTADEWEAWEELDGLGFLLGQ